MAWVKATEISTGISHWDSTPGEFDPDLWDILPIVDDRCPEGLEDVDADGNIFVPIGAKRADLWEQVKALRAEHTAAGVTVPGLGEVQTDDLSRGNITGLVVMAQIAIASGHPFSEPFTLADNSVVTLDAAGMIGMGVAVGQYVAAVYANARALRTAIEDPAADLAALEAIDLSAGWP